MHAGFIQADFARKIGMSLRYFSDVERGRENLTLDNIVALVAPDPDGWTWGVLDAAAVEFSATLTPESSDD